MRIHFNPRSHERSDNVKDSTARDSIISIHAPTRGATYDGLKDIETADVISIHAPTRGATPRTPRHRLIRKFQSTLPREERRERLQSASQHSYFNPRSHERSDVKQTRTAIDFAISIHAPTRGATNKSRTKNGYPAISIHAPTRGATSIGAPILSSSGFQSTLPREERLSDWIKVYNSGDFNPRSHERSD